MGMFYLEVKILEQNVNHIYSFAALHKTRHVCIMKASILTTYTERIAEDSDLLDFDAVSLSEWFPTFRKHLHNRGNTHEKAKHHNPENLNIRYHRYKNQKSRSSRCLL